MKKPSQDHPFAGLKWTAIDTPDFRSEAEEAAWWDTHKKEADDFIERAYQAGNVTRGSIAATATKQTTLRLRMDDIRKAKEVAQRKGLPYQTYLKMLIHEGLQREEKAG